MPAVSRWYLGMVWVAFWNIMIHPLPLTYYIIPIPVPGARDRRLLEPWSATFAPFVLSSLAASASFQHPPENGFITLSPS